ncbi:NAD(P)H-hydrate epimerase [Rhizobium azooxidifex]|uniref:Bifunctional NAD(P)H-hydrate repair enzyme n=1 Tax=Mycoplana azooxidifex TaxID=1636188 RepID=A0A7W6GH06_9HYPH|nr:NAD(P)H-hydrate dehydratase [Mycoplana azooxidifex]MBB3974885.1 NAD(P)H-hydrate epimerase [Mycoplana azooxidifex]
MHSELETIVVTPEEMAGIDRAAIASGIDGYGLMEKAGQAVAAAALRLFPGCRRFVVLAGPGNNGGDGYVAARVLSDSGCPVDLYGLGEPAPGGDADCARQRYAGPTLTLGDYTPSSGDVVIDALFGAGLSRDLDASVCALIDRVNSLAVPVVAVDLPSGVDGRTGQVRGAAFQAQHTVTFMCRKPGHLLMPGRALCGDFEIFDIGIPGRIVSAASHHLRVNGPAIWRMSLPQADPSAHKYGHGHLAVFSGGPMSTGAARLSAAAGLRAGAGLVTLLSPAPATEVNAAQLTAVMLRQVDDIADLEALLGDPRLSAFVLGPAFGDFEKARAYVTALRGRPLVLDADGITAFRDRPEALFEIYAGGDGDLVLTPHDGEFARLFPDIAADPGLSKVERARKAAAHSHAAVVLKGADTVIAAPDGRALINANAPPWLATAGSGDVLAGIIGAHLAQGMPAFEAAAAGVWRHGEAGRRAGAGATAEDLITVLNGFDQI